MPPEKRLSICLKMLLTLEAVVKLGILFYGTVAEDGMWDLNQISLDEYRFSILVVVAGITENITLTICAENNIPPLAWAIVDW